MFHQICLKSLILVKNDGERKRRQKRILGSTKLLVLYVMKPKFDVNGVANSLTRLMIFLTYRPQNLLFILPILVQLYGITFLLVGDWWTVYEVLKLEEECASKSFVLLVNFYRFSILVESFVNITQNKLISNTYNN